MGPDSHSCALFLPLLTVRAARPQRKLHYNFTPSGSKGRQIQALPNLVTTLTSSRDAGDLRASRLNDVFPPPDGEKNIDFLRQQPSIDRSNVTATDRVRLGQQRHLASRSGITTQFEKLFITAHYILAAF